MESTTSRPLQTVGTTLEADAAKQRKKIYDFCYRTIIIQLMYAAFDKSL